MKHFYFSIGRAALWCLVFGTSLSTAQTINKPTNESSPFVEPLKITEVGFKDGKKKSAAVTGGETWLDSLHVEVENTSGKTIKFAEVKVGFSGEKVPKELTALSLQYGGLKTHAFNAEPSVQPGAKARFAVSRSECGGLRTNLMKSGYAPTSAGQITARLGKVIFEDGTAWSGGKLFYPDPNNSNRWLIAESDSSGTTLSRNLFGTTAGMNFMPVSLARSPVRKSDCGTYSGFEILTDCCPETLVFSDTVDFGEPGNAALEPQMDNCPYTGTPSCVFYRVIPCRG